MAEDGQETTGKVAGNPTETRTGTTGETAKDTNRDGTETTEETAGNKAGGRGENSKVETGAKLAEEDAGSDFPETRGNCTTQKCLLINAGSQHKMMRRKKKKKKNTSVFLIYFLYSNLLGEK